MKAKYFCMLVGLVVGQVSIAETYHGRISGGENAPEDHIFAVKVYSAVNNVTPFGSLSTGVAVTPRHIVTVAQAIVGFNTWYIGYNSTHVHSQTITSSQDATAHAGYNPQLLHNNVGVIRVDDQITGYLPIDFMSNIQIMMFAFGFGEINNQNQITETLQRAILNPQTHDNCVVQFNEHIVREDNFCATSTSQIRNGDQGGPVINPLSSALVGIISSWGSDGTWSIMVDLRMHEDFLNAQLNL